MQRFSPLSRFTCDWFFMRLSSSFLYTGVFSIFSILATASSAQAELDCAQCRAVCGSDNNQNGYPADQAPDNSPTTILHNYPEAKVKFLDAQRRDPAFGGADLAGAVDLYRQAVKIDSGNPQYRNYLAASLLRSSNLPEAIYNLEKAVELGPNESKYLLNLGYAYHKNGQETRSLVYYMKALMIDPRNLRARLYAGYAMQSLGMPDDAAKEFARVLAQDPNSSEAKAAMSRLQSR